MENLHKDDAGVFMISIKNNKKYVGFDLELKRRVEKILSNYREFENLKKLNLEILLKCHRNYKGISETKPFLETKVLEFLEIHKAQKMPKDLDGLFARIQKSEVKRKSKYQIKREPKTMKIEKEVCEICKNPKKK